MYAHAAFEYLTGKIVPTGFFSSIELPNTPDNVALIPMAGVLTKSDVCDSPGSRTLTSMIEVAAKNPDIESIIIYSENCPGGQVDGTKIMADAIRRAKRNKPVIGAISGMACSAGMWVLSQCDDVFATSETDQVGCIGVMARMKNPNTVAPGEATYITVYSDLSPDKNAEFRDPEILKKSYLNPVAKLFHDAVIDGRGDRLHLDKEDVLSGKTYIAAEARKAGLIDGIISFDRIVSRSIFLSKNKIKK